MSSQTMRVPDGTKFHGTVTFPCQQIVNNHGEYCGALVHVSLLGKGMDAYDLTDHIDDELDRRCQYCRKKHRELMAESEAVDAAISESRLD